MEPIDPAADLLAIAAMPEVAAALRARALRIVDRWDDEVKRYLPDADPLTMRQVRDSIPAVLEKIAAAVESADPQRVEVLKQVGTAHGVARFQQDYDIHELLTEYRLLRRIVHEELARENPAFTLTHGLVVDMGIDIALHRGVSEFVGHLTTRLKASAEAESKYLSFLSHDLRNSLNGVTLRLTLLQRRLSPLPEFRQDVQDLTDAQRSIHETIDGMEKLLQAERLRKQQVELKLGPVELHDLTAHLIRQSAGQATAKGLRVENRVPVDAVANSDRELVSLVLQNLIGNALKYSGHGVVRIEAVDDEAGLRIAVTDEGPGIAPERIASLFDAFTRGETHGQSGLGLGLNIASQAARMLGSELHVRTELGRGSSFSFILPRAEPAKN